MATGRRAFEGKTPHEPDRRDRLVASRRRSRACRRMTPPALDHVVRKCLEKDPDDRWQSARDVRRSCSGSPRAARAPGCPGSSRRGGACARAWPGRVAAARRPGGPRLRRGVGATRAQARRRSSASRSRTPRASSPSARRCSRPTGACSRSTPPTRPGSRRSGSGRSTRSSRGRSRAPKARCARSGRPTAARSPSCPAGSCAAWPWPEGPRRRSATRSTGPTARGAREA